MECHRGPFASSEHRNGQVGKWLPWWQWPRPSTHAWECEDGLQLFSERAAPVLLLEMSIQPTLSRPSPQSQKVPNPGPLLLTPAPLFLLLSPLHCFIYSVFCRSSTRGQDGKCRWSSYCACCKVSPKQPRGRVCKARPEPSRLWRLLAGTLVVVSAPSAGRAQPWLSLLASKAMRQVQRVVRSGVRGSEEAKSSQKKAHA